MSSADEQNTVETANDRLGEPETPTSPDPNLPPFTQARGPETFVPNAEQRARYEEDKLQQEKMATLLGHLHAFHQGPLTLTSRVLPPRADCARRHRAAELSKGLQALFEIKK
ncbi:hypothetical protein B484DRAFT_405155 [Ochromonadaceae sp. CCMP2298]|nr:hypothetical protein B484DRAFT_405155 [Ochromonadaceae sp. CCMP2298]